MNNFIYGVISAYVLVALMVAITWTTMVAIDAHMAEQEKIYQECGWPCPMDEKS